MDLLSRYSGLVGGLARLDVVGVEKLFYCNVKENSLCKLL
jgi:hypothetical protein